MLERLSASVGKKDRKKKKEKPLFAGRVRVQGNACYMLLSTRIWKPSWTIPVIIVFLIITLSISKFTANPLVSVSIVNAGVPNVLLARTKEELDADAAFNYSNPLLKLDTNPIVVLLWNGASWAGWGATGQLDIPNYFTNVKPIPKPQCPVSCTFTIDHSKAGVADAIMLEPTVPFGIASWKSDPPALPEKMPHQTWLLYHYESSEYFPLIAQPPLREVMDGEVSYRQVRMPHYDRLDAVVMFFLSLPGCVDSSNVFLPFC